MKKNVPIEPTKNSHRYHPLSKRKFFRTLENSYKQKNFFEKNVHLFFERLALYPFPKDDKVLISLNNISKQFPVTQDKPNVLFDKVNLQIKRGDVISLIGANGVGKSTLLDILVGYLNPTSGNVEYNLEYTWSPTEKIGISYQKNVLLSSLSVWDYISFTHRLYKSNTTLEDLIIFCYAFGIEKFCKMRVNKLSGGQQQRLNAMLSLFHNPEIVLLDELCNNLDMSIKKKIINFIKNYFQIKNITAIIISHDVYEIKNMANRVMVIKNQKIANDLTTKQLTQRAGGIDRLIAESV
ncbi:MAG: ABC transporter ATP-binding protein [Mycoplasmataceae bacterium]|nr:ABC transporter ATP-binding protein [Mycoplasmataceae bacterium]